MSKYRFAGTLQEISIDSANIILKFIPDQEYISSYKTKKDADTKTYALLQPVDEKDVGWVFKYSDHVSLKVSTGSPCHHLTANLHCLLELDTTSGISGISDVAFLSAPANAGTTPLSGMLKITSIRAL